MHQIVLYPQNGDRIVTVDSVATLHPRHQSINQSIRLLRHDKMQVDNSKQKDNTVSEKKKKSTSRKK